MTKSDRFLWGVILLVVALMYIIVALEAYGQEAPPPRRAGERVAPGPDSTATPTPTMTPTPVPTATPTPIPDPVERPCQYVASPWGVPCDVREVCSMHIVPMHIGTPQTTMLSLVTDQTIQTVFSILRGPGEVSIEWHSPVRWAEWYVKGNEKPLQGCYCDERRGMVVICAVGRFVREVAP